MSLFHTSGKGFSLSRYVDPIPQCHVPIYQRDGTGRDNYCGFDNGGNTFMFESENLGQKLLTTGVNAT